MNIPIPEQRRKHFLYILATLIGIVFVWFYRGIGWPFVRGHVGDWLIVQLMYLLARLLIAYRWLGWLALGILLLSFGVEIAKYLAGGSIPQTVAAQITIGSVFDPLDLIAFVLGLATVLLTERFWKP